MRHLKIHSSVSHLYKISQDKVWHSRKTKDNVFGCKTHIAYRIPCHRNMMLRIISQHKRVQPTHLKNPNVYTLDSLLQLPPSKWRNIRLIEGSFCCNQIYLSTRTWWRHQMEHFPRNWPFVRGIHRSPVNSPHKGQWRGALMFSLICVWIYDWVNNREAGDLRRYRAHYGVIVMYIGL